MKRETKQNLWRYPVLLLILFIYLVPIYILVVISFKPQSDLSSYWHLSSVATWDNFIYALNKGHIINSMKNSLIITVSSVVLIVLIGSLTSYPLARKKSKYTFLMRNFSLGIMMVPPLSILVPLYSTLVDYSLINTYRGLILTLLTFELPMSIFMFTNFIKAIPTALDESAQIDGAGPARTFFQIIFPQLKPVTASVIILTGIQCWNDYQFSLYIMQKTAMKTVTVAISSFFSQESANLNAAAAASLVVIFPVIILFLALQKYFIKGMVDSAIK
ncbi:MAG: carbohydrate ABC transporter permease [Sphaerochaeta sp.]